MDMSVEKKAVPIVMVGSDDTIQRISMEFALAYSVGDTGMIDTLKKKFGDLQLDETTCECSKMDYLESLKLSITAMNLLTEEEKQSGIEWSYKDRIRRMDDPDFIDKVRRAVK